MEIPRVRASNWIVLNRTLQNEHTFKIHWTDDSKCHANGESLLWKHLWLGQHQAHWIYQNLMLMLWPETTGHTSFLFMTQGFRNDLSIMSRPQKCFFYLYGTYDIACKWQFHWSEKKFWGLDKKERSFLNHWVIRRTLVCFVVSGHDINIKFW